MSSSPIPMATLAGHSFNGAAPTRPTGINYPRRLSPKPVYSLAPYPKSLPGPPAIRAARARPAPRVPYLVISPRAVGR
eukprot:4909540-Pleurochrysis_carterae.AAC.1